MAENHGNNLTGQEAELVQQIAEKNVADPSEAAENNADADAEKGPCNAFAFKYALIWYIILSIVAFFIALLVARNTNTDTNPVTAQFKGDQTQPWGWIILSYAFWLFITGLFAYWMYHEAKKCKQVTTWLIFLLALLAPIILNLIIAGITHNSNNGGDPFAL